MPKNVDIIQFRIVVFYAHLSLNLNTEAINFDCLLVKLDYSNRQENFSKFSHLLNV